MNLNTEKGREMYATLIQLSDSFDEILPEITTFTEAINDLVDVTSGTIGDMVSDIQAVAREAGSAAQDWTRAAESLRDLLQDMRNDSNTSLRLAEVQAANAKSFSDLVSSARAGDVDAARDVPEAARNLLDSSLATAQTAAEFRFIENSIRAQVSALAGMSDLEAASKTIEQMLYEEQIALLGELSDYLNAEGVTADGIADFVTKLDDIQSAIDSVEMINADYLQQRLNVAVTAAVSTDVPDDVRALIESADEGLSSVISFAVRAEDLSPELRWLALQQASDHIKTIEMVASNTMTADETRLALGGVGTYLLNVETAFANGAKGFDTLLSAISDGTDKITLGGNFEFDPSTAFETALDGVVNPMELLRDDLQNLTAAVIAEADDRNFNRRVSALNTYAATLTSNSEGAYFANDEQLSKMADIAGIDIEGLTTGQIKRALTEFSDIDQLTGIVYDPNGWKEYVELNGPEIQRLNNLLKDQVEEAKKQVGIKQVKATLVEGGGGASTQRPSSYTAQFTDGVTRTYAVNVAQNQTLSEEQILGKYITERNKVNEQKAENLRSEIIALGGVPKYGSGGYHYGGLRVVGEHGPEIEMTGPARYYSTPQTQAMMAGHADAAGYAQLLAELRSMRVEQRQLGLKIEENTHRMQRTLRSFDVVGMPPERSAS
jgi:hypothetical protein